MTKKTKSNFAQGQAVSERETADGWGSPADSASPLRPDQHGTRRTYMGHGVLPPDSRRQPAMPGDELARQLINLSSPQIVHTATTRPRGNPGIADYPGSGPTGKGKAVHRFDYGLGPAVARPADLGRDPIDKYVGCRPLLPPASGPHGQIPRWHELSDNWVAGDDITSVFGGQGQ